MCQYTVYTWIVDAVHGSSHAAGVVVVDNYVADVVVDTDYTAHDRGDMTPPDTTH